MIKQDSSSSNEEDDRHESSSDVEDDGHFKLSCCVWTFEKKNVSTLGIVVAAAVGAISLAA